MKRANPRRRPHPPEGEEGGVLLRRVERNLKEHGLVTQGEKVLVAVSGGVDSMVLLEVLRRISKKNGWRLTVAHFNHLLRGEEADEDARFVAKRAGNLGLNFRKGREDIRKAAAEKGVSIEMAAREARHRFFVQAAAKENASKIALAHHADDQVELFWMRILRGNTGEGLGGMRWINRSPYSKERTIYLVRPFLNVSKKEIIRFAEAERIEFRPDSTNALPEYDRNRLRLKILPYLTRHHPALRETTARIMEVLGAEKEWLRAQARGWLEQRKPEFSRLHLALQREVIVVQILGAGITPNYELVERLRGNPGESFTVSPGQVAELSVSGVLSLKGIERAEVSNAEIKLDLTANGSVEWEGVKFSWREIKKGEQKTAAPAGREYFDAVKIGRLIELRHWRAGDRFQPIGMKRAVKLQDFFVNQKVPKAERHKRIVGVAKSGEIFWVEGLRIGENFKLTAATANVLEWRTERTEVSARANK